jgi:hypothetical protein
MTRTDTTKSVVATTASITSYASIRHATVQHASCTAASDIWDIDSTLSSGNLAKRTKLRRSISYRLVGCTDTALDLRPHHRTPRYLATHLQL